MADISVKEVPLPSSVDQMLREICAKHSQPPLDSRLRRELASAGKEASLKLLRTISCADKIRNLNGFVFHMLRNSTAAPTQESVCSSTPHGGLWATDDASSNSSIPEHLSRSHSIKIERGRAHAFSPQLLALGELEFRKAFLILSYIGRKKLEDVIPANEIRKLKDLPMGKFESEVWNSLAKQCVGEEIDRRKYLDWDAGKTYAYQCHVYIGGTYIFKGPYLTNTRTHLQRVLGDENVLEVKFADNEPYGSTSDPTSTNISAMYSKIEQEGILVAMRCFRFFVFKDGGKEEKKKNPTSSPVKCYFVCTNSNASFDQKKRGNAIFNKTIHEARSLFMHANTLPNLSKYVARFALILSKTTKLDVDLSSVHIERIEDIPCRDSQGCILYDEDGKPCIHTDGTGFISKDLAFKCPANVYKGKVHSNRNIESDLIAVEKISPEMRKSELRLGDPPLLIQCRLFNNGCAVKGIFLVNQKLPPRTIQIRPSMIKVERDPLLPSIRTANSLEIVKTSNQPKRTYLSKFLIALLSYGGVPKEYFMDLLMNSLEDLLSVYSNKRAALRVSLIYGEMDEYTVARMILSGIPLEEAFLQYRLSILMKEERKGLKEGRLPITDSYYLMGTADPTGLLNSDEVCIVLGSGQISGKVLVYRHPGLHFGDIHILRAIYVKELEDFIGTSKYAIFFPIKGPRSIADEMANGDFDGDMYWVSRSPELLEYFQAGEPWIPIYSSKNVSFSKKPNDFSAQELEHELFQLFLTTRFHPRTNIGVAADSWLVFMDRLLTLGDDCATEKACLKEKMLQLIDIYYDALDAPKSGKKVEVPKQLRAEIYPHYMERNNSYNSTSILGHIYDKVNSFQTTNRSSGEVRRHPCFNVELPETCLRLWKDHYDRYRSEMTEALGCGEEFKDQSANEVLKKYKQRLYGAAEFEESMRKMEDIFNDALAIYQVTYDYANSRKDAKYCHFAWRVAGPALCKYYTMKQSEKSVICLPSVLREIFS